MRNLPCLSARARTVPPKFLRFLAATRIAASGMGWPVSAASTRPSRIAAGRTASATSFAASRSSARNRNSCVAKRGSRTTRVTQSPRPMSGKVNRPRASVATAFGQARMPTEVADPWRTRIGCGLSKRASSAGPIVTRHDAVELELDPRGRLAAQIDQPAPDDLLGLQAELGPGLLGVGMELHAAERAVPGPVEPAMA